MANKLLKVAHELTEEDRNKIKSKNFAVHTSKEEKYPIEDIEHARNALARVAANGSPEEQAEVRAKVYSKYPSLKEDKEKKSSELLSSVLMLLKNANELTAEQRDKIKAKNFALPGDRYPIENEEHAANALARVSQFGTPEEQEEVRKKVYAKYPELAKHKVEKEVGKEEAQKLEKVAALNFLEKIKLAQRAIKFVTSKAKVASIIVDDFFKLDDSEKLASILDANYLKLLKEAFNTLSYGGAESYGGEPVGVWNAIEEPTKVDYSGILKKVSKPKVYVAGKGVRNKVINGADTGIGKFVKKLTRFAGKVKE